MKNPCTLHAPVLRGCHLNCPRLSTMHARKMIMLHSKRINAE